MAQVSGIVFPLALLTFQVLLVALYAGFVDYSTISAISHYPTPNFPVATPIAPNSPVATPIALNSPVATPIAPNSPVVTPIALPFACEFQDVHVMIFIGFGFLMTFLKKYGFGSVSYNMLIAAVTIQWATLLNAWVRQRVMKSEGHFKSNVGEIYIGVQELMTADFTAAAVLITYGAILGKASRLQLLVVAIVECVFFAVNETIIMEYLHISDVGGSIVVHLFGAYFGLSVSVVLRNAVDNDEKEGSVYHSDLFSMIGTLFLWVFWPSFNAGLLTAGSTQETRAIVNTYFSLAACVLTTFVVSSLVNKNFKLNMVHIQNATLAGGVAVGTAADLDIKPWGAILVGMIAGVISTLGYTYLTPLLNRLKIHDTCGVNNLHGMPGVLAGIIGAIAVPAIKSQDVNIYPKIGVRSYIEQGGYQFAAVMVSLTIAVVGGLFTGLIIKFLDSPDDDDHYDDSHDWEVPEYDNVYAVNTVEMKAVSPHSVSPS